MDKEPKRLWDKTHSEKEIYDMNSAANIIDEIIALYAIKIAEEKNKDQINDKIITTLETELSKFQEERNMITDAKVVKKILTLYAPALEKMIVEGVI